MHRRTTRRHGWAEKGGPFARRAEPDLGLGQAEWARFDHEAFDVLVEEALTDGLRRAGRLGLRSGVRTQILAHSAVAAPTYQAGLDVVPSEAALYRFGAYAGVDASRPLMATKAKVKSDAFEAIHAAAASLHTVGAITKATMRDFDEAAFVEPEPLTPSQIKEIREDSYLSQALFARRLNTSASTVEKWEIGAKRPSGLALKMLTVIRKHGVSVLD